ncbi:hypothetical protein [Micromonospora sp. SH-82]|uniref:hypothetical protein n=1 Tax=Micromonospora sp. SH-82 TaxID=3132938 RepID=UPI003EBA5D53
MTPLAVAAVTTGTVGETLLWGGIALVFTALVPYGVIWTGVRLGRLSDHHVGVREQRRLPFTVALASVLVGVGVLTWLQAPPAVVAMVAVMFTVLGAVTLMNLVWKASGHAAVSAGSAAVLTGIVGAPMLPAWIVVAAVCWSRVRLGDHTTAQVVVGAVAGAPIGAVTYAVTLNLV